MFTVQGAAWFLGYDEPLISFSVMFPFSFQSGLDCMICPRIAVGLISICPTGTVHYRKSRALRAAQIKSEKKKKKKIFIIDMNLYVR